jgi:hypothetical protein
MDALSSVPDVFYVFILLIMRTKFPDLPIRFALRERMQAGAPVSHAQCESRHRQSLLCGLIGIPGFIVPQLGIVAILKDFIGAVWIGIPILQQKPPQAEAA